MAEAGANRRRDLQRGIALEAFSLIWMVVEGAISISAGIAAHSFSLEAFGADSGLELISAGVVLRWLVLARAGIDPDRHAEVRERAEQIVGFGLLALAAYVAAGSLAQLVTRHQPESSTTGLVLAAAAAAVMPVLFLLKRQTAARLQSAALRGDAYESLACGWMAWALLAGLALHRGLGWWWADPLAGLVLVLLLVREGWRGAREWFARAGAPGQRGQD